MPVFRAIEMALVLRKRRRLTLRCCHACEVLYILKVQGGVGGGVRESGHREHTESLVSSATLLLATRRRSWNMLAHKRCNCCWTAQQAAADGMPTRCAATLAAAWVCQRRSACMLCRPHASAASPGCALYSRCCKTQTLSDDLTGTLTMSCRGSYPDIWHRAVGGSQAQHGCVANKPCMPCTVRQLSAGIDPCKCSCQA